MNPGDLVKSCWDGSYLPLYKEIHGAFVSEFYPDEIGIALDFSYSSTDVPYLKILTSSGKQGWVRYEKVEVIQ